MKNCLLITSIIIASFSFAQADKNETLTQKLTINAKTQGKLPGYLQDKLIRVVETPNVDVSGDYIEQTSYVYRQRSGGFIADKQEQRVAKNSDIDGSFGSKSNILSFEGVSNVNNSKK